MNQFNKRVKTAVGNIFNKRDDDGYTPIEIPLANNLTTSDPTYALAAPQGMILAAQIASLNIGTITTELATIVANQVTDEATITSQGTAITTLQTRATTDETNITSNTTAITALQTRATTDETHITSNTSAITALQTRATTDELSITTLSGVVNDSTIGNLALAANVSAALGATTNVLYGNSQLYSALTTTNSNLSTTNSSLSSLSTRVTTDEGYITALQTRATTDETNITNLSTTVNSVTIGNVALAAKIVGLGTSYAAGTNLQESGTAGSTITLSTIASPVFTNVTGSTSLNVTTGTTLAISSAGVGADARYNVSGASDSHRFSSAGVDSVAIGGGIIYVKTVSPYGTVATYESQHTFTAGLNLGSSTTGQVLSQGQIESGNFSGTHYFPKYYTDTGLWYYASPASYGGVIGVSTNSSGVGTSVLTDFSSGFTHSSDTSNNAIFVGPVGLGYEGWKWRLSCFVTSSSVSIPAGINWNGFLTAAGSSTTSSTLYIGPYLNNSPTTWATVMGNSGSIVLYVELRPCLP